jgi:hypothetical protein
MCPVIQFTVEEPQSTFDATGPVANFLADNRNLNTIKELAITPLDVVGF